MKTVTKKHVYVLNHLSKFAQVTVGQPTSSETPEVRTPSVLLSGSEMQDSPDKRAIVAAAEKGIKGSEREFKWSGPSHCLMSIEGLLVDGIDSKSAQIAAAEATKELICMGRSNLVVRGVAAMTRMYWVISSVCLIVAVAWPARVLLFNEWANNADAAALTFFLWVLLGMLLVASVAFGLAAARGRK